MSPAAGRCLGAVLAESLAGCSAVRAIYERVEVDRCALVVILDGDDERTLDVVFEGEQELFRAFPSVPFDLRVMRAESAWNADAFRVSCTVRFERA